MSTYRKGFALHGQLAGQPLAGTYMVEDTEQGWYTIQDIKTPVGADNTPQFLAGTCNMAQLAVGRSSQDRYMGDELL